MPKVIVVDPTSLTPIYQDDTCWRVRAISKQIHSAQNIDASYSVYKKGRSKKGVVYPQDEICYIVKGAGMLTTPDGTKIAFKEGDVVYRPAGAMSDVEMTEDSISVCMFSPAR